MSKAFVDVHNHFAWDIDDGMPSQADAEIALKNAYKDGIRSIIATPHYIPGEHTVNDIKDIHQRILDLKLLAESVSIKIYEGAELFLNSSYLEMLEAKLCPSLAGSRYLLCEFDVRKELSHREYDVEEKLYEIKVQGYVPVIAHVERYFHKKVDMDRVKSWVEMGYKIQVNRTSLLGMHGTICKENALQLIRQGLVHVVASDAHRCKGSRVCLLTDAYEFLNKEFDEDVANILCKENPMRIIQNETLVGISVVKQSIFKKLFKRS